MQIVREKILLPNVVRNLISSALCFVSQNKAVCVALVSMSRNKGVHKICIAV